MATKKTANKRPATTKRSTSGSTAKKRAPRKPAAAPAAAAAAASAAPASNADRLTEVAKSIGSTMGEIVAKTKKALHRG